MLKFELSKRLTRASEYQVIFRNPDIRIRSNKILLLAKANLHRYPRLGLVVGKKHLKKAIQRNRCKRAIRESFRLNQKNLPNYDMIVIALAGINSVTQKELTENLGYAWLRLNKLAKKS